MRSRVLAVLTGFVALLSSSVIAAQSSAAHTIVRDADPGPGERVSGVVASASVVFLDPVGPSYSLTVTDGSGEPVPGLGSPVLEGRTVFVEFDPLVEPGTYQVDYMFSSADGHPGAGAHQFRFEGTGPGSPALAGAGTPDAAPERGPDEPIGGLRVGAMVLLAVVVAGVVLQALLERRRRADPTASDVQTS